MRFFISILLIISTLTACRSEFEKVRLSNDPERILNMSIKYYDKGEYLRAQTLMELILNQYRGTRQGEELFFKYAYTHYHLGNFTLAATYFTNFTTTFAYSSYTEEADYMIAYSYYKQSPSFRLDQESSIKAINAFQDFANKYPESQRVEECNKLIDELRGKLEEKAFAQGQLYYNLSDFEAAITSFKNMLKEFPETKQAEEIHFLIFKSSFQYALKSVYDKRAERYDEAREMYKEYIDHYPKGEHAREARDINRQITTNIKNLSK
jgi:outer membrane protein assembly factor BamD